MKHYSKQCKNIKEVNTYLKKIGCEGFMFDDDVELTTEFDYDGWQNADETEGASVQVSTKYEVSVTRYTKKDLERYEKEFDL